jgi:hypothetical protein
LTLQFQLLLLILKLPDSVVQSLNLSGVILLLVTRGEGKHACEASKREKTTSHIRAVYWTACIPAIFNPRRKRGFLGLVSNFESNQLLENESEFEIEFD